MQPATQLAVHADLLRQMVVDFANALMSADVDGLCGADYGVVSQDRTNRRNGYRTRDRGPDASVLPTLVWVDHAHEHWQSVARGVVGSDREPLSRAGGVHRRVVDVLFT